MIARESLVLAKPVAVGRPPGSLRRPGGYAAYAGGILRICRAFNRKDLYKIFYENNVFELIKQRLEMFLPAPWLNSCTSSDPAYLQHQRLGAGKGIVD